MKKREFKEKAVVEIMSAVTKALKTKGKNLKLKVDSKNHNTYLTLQADGNMVKVNLYQSGEIKYRLWDCIGNANNDYISYYSYIEGDFHEEILRKINKDFFQLFKLTYTSDFHEIFLDFDYKCDTKEFFKNMNKRG